LNPSVLDKENFVLGGFFLGGGRAFDHAHDVGLLHDQELLTVDLDLCPRPLAEQDPLARLEFDGSELAVLIADAGSDGDDLALLRLFLNGVGNDDPALRLILALDAADDDAVVSRTKFHGSLFWSAGINRRGEIASLNSAVRLDLNPKWLFLALVTRECQKKVYPKRLRTASANQEKRPAIQKSYFAANWRVSPPIAHGRHAPRATGGLPASS
jgi:hypothetical protein